MTQRQDAPSNADKGQKRVKARGHMFLVDVPTFAKVCSLGDADAAAAYLILAAGTGPDNRTSTWSREAINKRTALNWRKADVAISKLEQNGLIRWLSGKGTRKPRIDLPPIETRKPMQKKVAELAARIERGDQPRNANEQGTAGTGEREGWFARDDDGIWSTIPDRPIVKAYLPMELVGDAFGVAGTATSTMVDRIRMSRDPMALQLLVDLYALQDLAEHGGVDRKHFYRKFNREKSGTNGSLQIWKFERGSSYVSWDGSLVHHLREPTAAEKKEGKNAGSDFFERAQILSDAGAMEWVYFLAEDESDMATLIYPVAVERHNKVVWTELESIVGGYATRAACALKGLTADQARQWEICGPHHFILPADRLARQAAVVGIPRLRHRARTSNASRWRQELVESADSNIPFFRGIIAENAHGLLNEADRRFADFNAVSTVAQRDINDSYRSGMHISPSLRDGGGENEFSLSPHDHHPHDEGIAVAGVSDWRMDAG